MQKLKLSRTKKNVDEVNHSLRYEVNISFIHKLNIYFTIQVLTCAARCFFNRPQFTADSRAKWFGRISDTNFFQYTAFDRCLIYFYFYFECVFIVFSYGEFKKEKRKTTTSES